MGLALPPLPPTDKNTGIPGPFAPPPPAPPPPAPEIPPDTAPSSSTPRTRRFFPETWVFLVNQTKYAVSS